MDSYVTCGLHSSEETFAIMAEPGSSQGQGQSQSGTFTYQNGVWLSKGQGARSEKYQKWTEDFTKSQVERLDRQEHHNLVKLNGRCLQVRTELRDLKQQRFRLSRRQSSSESTDGGDSTPSTPPASTSSFASGRGLWKSASSSSLMSSTTSLGGRRSGMSSSSSSSLDADRGGAEGSGAGGKGLLLAKGFNPDLSAMRVKNLHSARALSKLNNNMHIEH